MDLNIETDADLQEIDKLLSQQQHSFAGFARQMWAYITVNQLLAERWDIEHVACSANCQRMLSWSYHVSDYFYEMFLNSLDTVTK